MSTGRTGWKAAAYTDATRSVAFRPGGPGETVVDVHQVVRDREGNLVLDRMVQHVYFIEGGLIRSMQILEP
jgi:hypothetical protein